MKTKTLKIVLINLLLLFVSCREDTMENEIAANTEVKSSKVTLGAYTSPLPYNLNVVYFIPSDVPARPEYERRVSEFLLAGQEYFRQNMYNWGYGNRTFGLLKNPSTNRVKINIVYGKYPISTYNSSAGGQVLSEVNAWLAAHPTDKTSDHTIVFTATPSLSTDIPYYGLGRTCFVGDHEANDYQYFNQNTTQGNQAKAYMGGFLHELGHGLGLPHDALPKSQQNQSGYGTSLMSWGNQTYGHSSTILTKSSAAILNNSQPFSTTLKPAGYFYNGNSTFNITSINKSFSNNNIYVSGTYNVGSPITAINVYFIPKDAYYHAVSGVASINTTNFYANVNISDFYFASGQFSLVIQAQFANGLSNWKTYPFTINNGAVTFNF
jgi:hypothetical protein